MNILICNERFLFRFGLDRVLIVLGKGFKDAGHNVTIMGNKFDHEIIEAFSSNIITVPHIDDYFNLNELTAAWLDKNWKDLFNEHNKPDLVLIGGWPFFASIPVFEKHNVKTVFHDGGAVPLEGYKGGALETQLKVRKMRETYLPQASLIIAISEFISNSQSKLDSRGVTPVQIVMNGSDHMDMDIWPAKNLNLTNSGKAFELMSELKQKGNKIILCLGRWEPFCYKNSEASFEIMESIVKKYPQCVLLILSDSAKDIPKHLKDYIIPIGFPDDQELQKIMHNIDLGLSLSLWEGFNLSLAEMQWIEKPALAFNVGAHPEVVVHPWYLGQSNQELVEKTVHIFEGNDLSQNIKEKSLKKFKEFFTWGRAVEGYLESFKNLLSEPYLLIIDVTNASKDPANSGVIRVTRRLSNELQNFVDPLFVVWDHSSETYYLPNENEFNQLSQYNGPKLKDQNKLSKYSRVRLDEYLLNNQKPAWILFTETINELYAKKVRNYARMHGIQLAGIFYDAIALIRPDLCNEEVRNNHRIYMEGLSECDVVIPISNFSTQSLLEFWDKNGNNATEVITNLLPGEFGGTERKSISKENVGKIEILCVSTLEPRKNHKTLIKACLQLQQNHPELDWALTLVGNRYAGNTDIPEYVEEISKKNKRIQWLGIVDDQKLSELYMNSTFTVYPSEIEGFGMPIMESIWYGKPCICFNEGVMSELASEGGCLTTNVKDVDALSRAIYILSTDQELYKNLTIEANSRKIKTWSHYAKEFHDILKFRTKNKKFLDQLLFPNQFFKEYTYSELLGLNAVLDKINPQCTLVIGYDESISSISQKSKIVFCIDSEERTIKNENVSIINGPDYITTELLLSELQASNINVDLVIINRLTKSIINYYGEYKPVKPLLILIHDILSETNREILNEVKWNESKHIHSFEYEFISGAQGTNNLMTGGYGVAVVLPEVRQTELEITIPNFDKGNIQNGK